MKRKKPRILSLFGVIFAAIIIVAAVPATLAGAIITVPDDYLTIQAAISAASTGDTVYVRAGTYYENVTIDKSLTLQGEDRNTTIINGGGTGNVIYISANYVTIQGLTATNGEFGIYLIPNWSIHHVIVKDCIVTLNMYGFYGPHVGGYITIEDCEISKSGRHGIYSHQFSNSIIKNCKVFNNSLDPSLGYGIDIAWCRNSSIVGCDIYSNNYLGIIFDSTWDCIVEHNHIWGNKSTGINIFRWGNGFNNIVRNNIIENNVCGVSTSGGHQSYNNFIYHNDFISNERQAQDYNYQNIWDNGYPSGGNFWSDYTGVDGNNDGIGDTPHVFVGNQDNYPLMKRYNIIQVSIDIKPGSDPNSINLSSAGVISVAILSSETFDATTVNPETVMLAGAEVKMVGKSGKYLSHESDVNSDGLLDLVCQVLTDGFRIEPCESIAVLDAKTRDGQSIRGEDTIRIVPDK